jgi:hypothetical protein
MPMPRELTPNEVGTIGENHVADWLRQRGYVNIKVDTHGPGSTDIEADSSIPDTPNILVQVKSTATSKKPAGLSSDEKRNLKSRAGNLGRDAYLAQVTIIINQDGSLSKGIEWSNLQRD